MQSIEIASADGTALPICWFDADGCKGVLLVLPALGIQAKLYTPLAREF